MYRQIRDGISVVGGFAPFVSVDDGSRKMSSRRAMIYEPLYPVFLPEGLLDQRSYGSREPKLEANPPRLPAKMRVGAIKRRGQSTCENSTSAGSPNLRTAMDYLF